MSEKKRDKNKTIRTVGLVVAASMFVAAFIFLAPNVTGNAIAGIDVSVTNIFGLLLFFAGVIVTYVSVTRMLRMDFNMQ